MQNRDEQGFTMCDINSDKGIGVLSAHLTEKHCSGLLIIEQNFLFIYTDINSE